MRSSYSESCVLGLASMQNADSARPPLAAFATWIGDRAQAELSVKFVDSYEALAECLRQKKVDFAWLPPIVFVLLEKAGVVEPLVSNHRGGQAAFQAVLVVHADSRIRTLDGLRGTRAAWVDPYSATGYVLPRVQLAALGVDPRTAFAAQRFYGSHDAALSAIVSGQADVAGTFARVDGAGIVSSGSWSNLLHVRSMVRVLATLGTIPADAIAVRNDVDPALRERMAEAFVAASNDEMAVKLIRRLFGVEEFRRGNLRSYAALRTTVEQGRASGLLDELHPL
jgi:phosphate/phosphite/phosphonate ABC transporter binding protein